MIATVAFAPVWPLFTNASTPYAARTCCGLYPQGAYGSGSGKPPPYGGSVVSSFSAQNDEQGGAFRKPAGNFARGSAAMLRGCISDSDSSTPITPDTAPATEAGTVSSRSAARKIGRASCRERV